MKTLTTQQEILIIKGSAFSQNQMVEKDADGNKKMTASEQLENACWNGLLDQLFPEIIIKPAAGKKLFVWHIQQCESFLQVELSETPEELDEQFSINPYIFLPAVFIN